MYMLHRRAATVETRNESIPVIPKDCTVESTIEASSQVEKSEKNRYTSTSDEKASEKREEGN